MENFSGLTPEEEARLLDLEKSVELDKARPKIKKDFLSFVKYVWPEFIEGSHHKKINKKFNEVLNLYLKFHKKKIFIPYKVKINDQAINYYIKECFSKYKITFTKLRKIYIKEKVLPLSFDKSREVIDNMGYGISCNLVILYQNNKMN